MEDLWIDSRSGRIFAKSAGTGRLILGLHGWSQRNGWHTWEPLMTPLANAGFAVVSVDMPGWGNSEATEKQPMSTDRACSVVLQILDALSTSSATLMGKSWGGGVALQVALDQPQRVERLILTAPAFRDLKQLSSLRQPVLLAWSVDDPVIPFSYARQYEEMASNLW